MKKYSGLVSLATQFVEPSANTCSQLQQKKSDINLWICCLRWCLQPWNITSSSRYRRQQPVQRRLDLTIIHQLIQENRSCSRLVLWAQVNVYQMLVVILAHNHSNRYRLIISPPQLQLQPPIPIHRAFIHYQINIIRH